MKKVIFLLDIGGYAPEITALTRPLVERYAAKIGAEIHLIRERKFPEWDLDYEKLQIYDLIPATGCDWAMYLDSDAVLHPELPDLSDLVPPDTVANNGCDFAPIRWRYDEYFRRDGRHIGCCNWLAVAPAGCRDLWRPLDDLTFEEAVARITLTVEEEHSPVTREHLVSDYALSRNVARFGLKYTTLGALWKLHGLPDANFFYHEYLHSEEVKLQKIREILAKWRLG